MVAFDYGGFNWLHRGGLVWPHLKIQWRLDSATVQAISDKKELVRGGAKSDRRRHAAAEGGATPSRLGGATWSRQNHALGRPVPGNHNDCTAYRDSGAAAACRGAHVMADGGSELPAWQHELNTVHADAVVRIGSAEPISDRDGRVSQRAVVSSHQPVHPRSGMLDLSPSSRIELGLVPDAYRRRLFEALRVRIDFDQRTRACRIEITLAQGAV